MVHVVLTDLNHYLSFPAKAARKREPVLRISAVVAGSSLSQTMTRVVGGSWPPCKPLMQDRTLPHFGPDRRLEGKAGVPWEEYPGVLGYFGDEGIDQRAPHRLGVDRGKMRIWQQVAYHTRGLAGVDQVVDDEYALATAAASLDKIGCNALDHF